MAVYCFLPTFPAGRVSPQTNSKRLNGSDVITCWMRRPLSPSYCLSPSYLSTTRIRPAIVLAVYVPVTDRCCIDLL